MNQMSFAETTRKKPIEFSKLFRGKSARSAENRVNFGTNKAGKNKIRVMLQIGELIMEELGWLIGDKIDLIYHPEDRLVIVKRVKEKESGFKLYKAAGGKGRAVTYFKWIEPIPYHDGVVPMKDMDVKKDPVTGQKCLFFNIPKDFTFYNGEE